MAVAGVVVLALLLAVVGPLESAGGVDADRRRGAATEPFTATDSSWPDAVGLLSLPASALDPWPLVGVAVC